MSFDSLLTSPTASNLSSFLLLVGAAILLLRTVRAVARSLPGAAAPLGHAQTKQKSGATPLRQVPSPRRQWRSVEDLVARTDFNRCRLLNKEEYRLFRILEIAVADFGHGYRLFSQVCVRELICPTGPTNDQISMSKELAKRRFDFVIIAPDGLLVAAIEYQGTGHHLDGHAFKRDAIKREVVRKSGAAWAEFEPDFTRDEVRAWLRKTLSKTPRARVSAL